MSNYLDPCLSDNGGELAGVAYTAQVNQRSRTQRVQHILGTADKDASGRIVNEQSGAIEADIRIDVGHHRSQMNRIFARRLHGGEAMRLVRGGDGGQTPQRGLYGLGSCSCPRKRNISLEQADKEKGSQRNKALATSTHKPAFPLRAPILLALSRMCCVGCRIIVS
jgi:hypothetical protein